MTPRGRDQGQEQRAGRRWRWSGGGWALAVSSEGLLEDSAGARLGPRDALSPRRGLGMRRRTMDSRGSEGTPI